MPLSLLSSFYSIFLRDMLFSMYTQRTTYLARNWISAIIFSSFSLNYHKNMLLLLLRPIPCRFHWAILIHVLLRSCSLPRNSISRCRIFCCLDRIAFRMGCSWYLLSSGKSANAAPFMSTYQMFLSSAETLNVLFETTNSPYHRQF